MRTEGGMMKGGMYVTDRRVIGWTTACPLCSKSGGICWPLWLCACSPVRWLREGISEPMTSRLFLIVPSEFLSCSFILFVFLAVSLLCSGCSAQSAPASYSIIICQWPRLAIQVCSLITCVRCGACGTGNISSMSKKKALYALRWGYLIHLSSDSTPSSRCLMSKI